MILTYRDIPPKKDWVQIEGASVLPIGKLLAMEANLDLGFATAMELVKDGMFFENNGLGDPIENWRSYANLTLQQWDWLRSRIWRAAREEVIDPEP